MLKITIKYILFSVLSCISLPIWGISYDFYSQTVSLYKFNNVVTQNRMRALSERSHYELYAGIWWDDDQRTGKKEAFTDAQISPLVGIQSKLFGNNWMYSRAFAEGRQINRLGPFPDDRKMQSYDVRVGFIGYGLQEYQNIFVENYYAFFYTRLYGDRLILQGWSKQGIKFGRLSFFNELMIDTFDFTRDSDASFDARPGIRFEYRLSNFTLQLLHQWIYHFSNIRFSGRNEQRSTLVIAFQI